MENCSNNRKVVSMVGDMVETLFAEFEYLPLSPSAKTALIQVMMSEIMKRDGQTVYLRFPDDGAEEACPAG